MVDQEIADWNELHSNTTAWHIESRHWKTDAVPDMSDRPQGVINHQLIDDADVLVAIFWSRFGTPTGAAASGTEEEVRRGIKAKKLVLLYFSDLEPLPAGADEAQLQLLQVFRKEMMAKGLAWKFRSRTELKASFRDHLSRFMDKRMMKSKRSKPSRPPRVGTITQSGNNNTQIVGNHNIIATKPPVVRNIIKAPKGSVSPSQQRKIAGWIESLVENTTGRSQSDAFKKWWGQLKGDFEVTKYEQIPSAKMAEVESWYREQFNILKAGRRTSAPELWRSDRYAAIKARMKQMGRTKEEYYPELSDRLNMKRPFTSLTKLTKTDLGRVDKMVERDAKKSR